ncbi:MAG: NUDIX hydrolase [Proteobacteria bacterium]|nr:NUDIX hydrolase [Pseudomonadota bacterium]
MHRDPMLKSLVIYQRSWVNGHIPYQSYQLQEESQNFLQMLRFIESQTHCLERTCPEGHITASALVTDHACQKVLLTLHAKLGKWLQLGGHVDGEVFVHEAALREAREESGQAAVEFYPYESRLDLDALQHPIPFDLDIHRIPARHNEPEHLHYDFRFLCRLSPDCPLNISEESKDLRWLSLKEAQNLTNERSMLRQFYKLVALRERILSP